MSRPSLLRFRLVRAAIAVGATMAVVGLVSPVAAAAIPQAADRFVVVFGGTFASSPASMAGHGSSLRRRDAVQMVAASGGQVVADMTRSSGVMLVESARADFARAMRAQPLVAAVGRNYAWQGIPAASASTTVEAPASVAGGSADPLASQQWDMRMIRAAKAQQTEAGWRKVQVGVLDTGIDASHVDFTSGGRSNVDTGLGRSFTSDPAVATDSAFHGTHVAGTIAAQINGLGLVGVAPGVTLVPVKVCEGSGYCFADAVIQGIHYAGQARLEIINMSFFVDDSAPLGSTQFKCSSDPDQNAWRLALEREVSYARSRGVALVASIGNDDLDLNHPEELQAGATDDDCDQLPAETRGVTAVVALGPNGEKASYSSYGDGKADVAAPGGDSSQPGTGCDNQILSTLPGNTYGCIQGTSMAAPHAAGVAALIVSSFGSFSGGDVRMPVGSVDRMLKGTSVDIGQDGYDECYGHGRVDAVRAIRAAQAVRDDLGGCSDY